MTDVMLDLETLSTRQDAAVVQIGACYFDRLTGAIGRSVKHTIPFNIATSKGAHIDPSTVAWWLEQSDEARSSILDSSFSMHCLEDYVDLMQVFLKDCTKIWCHASFDIGIIQNMFRSTLSVFPISHRDVVDLRTLVYLADLNIKQFPRVGTHHDALADCIFQVGYAVKALDKLYGTEENSLSSNQHLT